MKNKLFLNTKKEIKMKPDKLCLNVINLVIRIST